jgi:Protein of unknown function (DUF3019)
MALQQFSSVRSIRSNAIHGGMALASVLLSLGLLSPSRTNAASSDERDDIQLELRPRICTLTANDTQCDTVVHATWQSPRNESLCLVIVGRPEVKRCWEKYSEGTYSIELTFSADLVFQLKDLDLQQVLASDVLRVIREAIRYRHKRREPWNIFA